MWLMTTVLGKCSSRAQRYACLEKTKVESFLYKGLCHTTYMNLRYYCSHFSNETQIFRETKCFAQDLIAGKWIQVRDIKRLTFSKNPCCSKHVRSYLYFWTFTFMSAFYVSFYVMFQNSLFIKINILVLVIVLTMNTYFEETTINECIVIQILAIIFRNIYTPTSQVRGCI